jgi:hypothetical protein
MANKRSHAAATLVVTAASDIFTQDVEDLPQFEREPAPQQPDHTKRYTPDELAAARSKPEPPRREAPPTTPPEDGFEALPDDDQRYGGPLNQEQLTIFHAKIGEKAKRLGVDAEAIKAHILTSYRVESSKDLGQDVWSSVLTAILKLKTADLRTEVQS